MSLPLVDEALWDLVDLAQFAVVDKGKKDFQTQETIDQVYDFRGNLQPIPPQKLLVKPEGQRTWKWWLLRCREGLNLDWIVEDSDGKQYRVMSRQDWSRAGYNEYELTEMPLAGS